MADLVSHLKVWFLCLVVIPTCHCTPSAVMASVSPCSCLPSGRDWLGCVCKCAWHLPAVAVLLHFWLPWPVRSPFSFTRHSMTTVTVFCMAVAYSVTAGLDARSTPSCRFTSERRGLSSHLALIRFVQHPLCLRFVSRLSSATDSDKLTKAHEAKKNDRLPDALRPAVIQAHDDLATYITAGPAPSRPCGPADGAPGCPLSNAIRGGCCIQSA